jgi:hypothetical protein
MRILSEVADVEEDHGCVVTYRLYASAPVASARALSVSYQTATAASCNPHMWRQSTARVMSSNTSSTGDSPLMSRSIPRWE